VKKMSGFSVGVAAIAFAFSLGATNAEVQSTSDETPGEDIVFLSSSAETAEVQLVSGEVLQGEILSVEGGMMELGCSWGEASLKLEAVRDIYFAPQGERISAKGLILKDGTSFLGVELARKDEDGFIFSLPYGKLILTETTQLSYVNLQEHGGLVLPDEPDGESAHILLQSRGDLVQEKIVGQLLRYENRSFRVRTAYGILEVPEAATRGIGFIGRKPSLERLGLKPWDDLPVQGKPVSFKDDVWRIETPFGFLLVERYGVIEEITYPPRDLPSPAEDMMLVSLRGGTDLWGDILAWKEKEVTFSTTYGTLSLPSVEILKVSSVSAASYSNTPPEIVSLAARPEVLKLEESSLVTCLVEDPEGGPISYEWSASKGLIEGSEPEVMYRSPSRPGTYLVEVTVTDQGGLRAKKGIWIPVSELGGDWPAFGYDSRRAGATVSRGPKEGAALLWKYETGNTVFSSPAVAEGVLYVGSSDRNLYALDVNSGELLWKFETGNTVFSSPAVAEGVLYIGSSDKSLYALNANSGELLWKFETGADLSSSPAVAEGIVYIGSSDRNLYALNTNSGKLLWKYRTRGEVSSSPAVAEGIVYIGSSDRNLYALNAKSGKLLWRYRTRGDVRSSPAVAEGVLYVGSYDRSIYALNANSGELLWKFETRGTVFSSPAVAEGVVYVGSSDRGVYALNAHSGELIWRYYTEGDVRSSPAVAQGIVYIGSSDRNLYALNAHSGELLWKFETRAEVSSSPAIAEGIVYVGSYDNHTYSIAGEMRSEQR